MPSLRYAALQDPGQQIRLLELQLDSEDSSLLTCTLTIWSIKHVPAYVAISYTWGDPASVCTINVNGSPTEVRTTCFDALNQVGKHRKCRYYWLDALCIDQDNPQEKAAQVAIMADIFEKADRVVAYIGPATDESDGLMETLRQLALNRRSFNEKCGFTGESGITSWTTLLSADLAKMDDTYFGMLIRALIRFSMRPWFSRLWVAQEIFVAKEINLCCGDRVADMMELQYLLATRPFSLILMLHKHNVRTPGELEWLQKLAKCHGIDFLQSQMRKIWGDDVAFKGREWDEFVLHPGLYHLMAVIQLARRADRTAQRIGVPDSETPAFFPYVGARYVDLLGKEDPELTGGIDAVQSLVNELHCQDPRDKVFGTLRFLNRMEASTLRPDYTVAPFDLALKVLRVYAGGQAKSGKCFRLAEDLVRNLKLDLSTPEVKLALLQRQNRMRADPNLGLCDEKEYVLRERDCHCSRLIATKSGVLSALLQIETCIDPKQWRKVPKDIDWKLFMDRFKPLTERYRPLFVFGDLCGMVSSAARPGDYLVQLHGELRPPAILVVRRPSIGQCHPQIVGTAHLRPDVRTCVDPYEMLCHCFRKFDLRFSAEDLLLLAVRHVAVVNAGARLTPEHLNLLNIGICKGPCSSRVEFEWTLSKDLNDRKAEALHEKGLFEKLKNRNLRFVLSSFARHLNMQAMQELMFGRRTLPGKERDLAIAFAPFHRLWGSRLDESDEQSIHEQAMKEDLFNWGNILEPGSSFMRKMEMHQRNYLDAYLP